MTALRDKQAPAPTTRAEFHKRFSMRFYGPVGEEERADIDRIEEIAWGAWVEGRGAPTPRLAGRGFGDPE